MKTPDRTRGFYDQALETMVSEERRRRQRLLIRRLLDYVSERSPAYREKFLQAGADQDKIEKFEDLPFLPLTRRAEIIQSHKAHPPFSCPPALCSTLLWNGRMSSRCGRERRTRPGSGPGTLCS